MSLRRWRSVIHEKSFEESSKLVEADPERFDEVLRGIEWAVQGDPDLLEPPSPGSELRVLKTFPSPLTPPLRVFYKFNHDDSCSLWWVEEDPDPFPDLADDDDVDEPDAEDVYFDDED